MILAFSIIGFMLACWNYAAVIAIIHLLATR